MPMFDGNIGDLVNNRNFQSLLAGFGQKLDPEGVGGAIGAPTQEMIKMLGTQEAVDKMNTSNNDFRTQLLQLLSGKMTPAGEKGVTSANITGDQITLKGDLKGIGETADTSGLATDSNALDINRGVDDIAPFYSALLGR